MIIPAKMDKNLHSFLNETTLAGHRHQRVKQKSFLKIAPKRLTLTFALTFNKGITRLGLTPSPSI